MRQILVALATMLATAMPLLAQDTEAQSSWSRSLSMYLPFVVLVVVWLVIWRFLRFGKGGYRKLIMDNQERMVQMERHLATISQQLERIATALERSTR